MNIFEQMYHYFEQANQKTRYLYMGIFFGIVIALHLIVGYFFFSRYNALHETLANVNDQRSTTVQRLIGRIHEMKRQKASVNTMLAEDENFKIGGYFKNLISSLGLTAKKEIETTSQADKDELYKESVLNAKFSSTNMQELTELLEQIENNKRIYIKEIEITESKKIPNTVDFVITIATLQPKASGMY